MSDSSLSHIVAPSADQLQQYAAIAHQAFVMPLTLITDRFARLDADAVRITTCGGRTAGGLLYMDDAQRFGRRNVRTWAIALVAVSPEFRGAGVGRSLMGSTLVDAHRQGVPLCSLFASTPAFYRRLGFETTGVIIQYQIPIAKLGPAVFDSSATIERIADTDHLDAELAAYAAAVDHAHGPLALAHPELRRRVFAADHIETHPYRIRFGNTVEGYLIFEHERSGGLLRIHRQAIATARAGRAALAFLAEHRTLCQNIAWPGGPADPLRLLTPSNAFTRAVEEWYLRITHVEAALQQRGYPPVHCELHLDVTDDLIPANAGRYVLSIRGGQPTVQRGGTGRIALDVGSLASIFASHLSPRDLHRIGRITAPDDDLQALAAAFAGPQPYLLDRF